MSALHNVKWQLCLGCFRWVEYRTASALSGNLVARTSGGVDHRLFAVEAFAVIHYVDHQVSIGTSLMFAEKSASVILGQFC